MYRMLLPMKLVSRTITGSGVTRSTVVEFEVEKFGRGVGDEEGSGCVGGVGFGSFDGSVG